MSATRAAGADRQRFPRRQSRLRLGFLGVGWIGRNRMEALIGTGLAEVAAIAEPDGASRENAIALVARPPLSVASLDELLAVEGLDGIVIATPSALHAEQAIAALERGLPVFCQKPLGRSGAETSAVVEAARRADRLLGVDLSYRHLSAVAAVRALLETGELGRIYAADLTFHNAYGPDKPWFTQRSRSGGGCLIDLGIHLLDLALWLTGSSDADVRSSVLMRSGSPVSGDGEAVEDLALAQLRLDRGVEARLACSWFLSAGRDCVIELALLGTEGAAAVVNVGGSFYDFRAEHRRGTSTRLLSAVPDDWGGRALALWARRLIADRRFDPVAETYVAPARILDRIYAAAS